MTVQFDVRYIESTQYIDWEEFVRYQSPDPWDDYGGFTVTVGEVGDEAGSNFQVCVATPRAVGRMKRLDERPGILVDHYDPETVERAIIEKVTALKGNDYQDVIDQLRKFMHWEYEGM